MGSNINEKDTKERRRERSEREREREREFVRVSVPIFHKLGFSLQVLHTRTGEFHPRLGTGRLDWEQSSQTPLPQARQ